MWFDLETAYSAAIKTATVVWAKGMQQLTITWPFIVRAQGL